MPFQALASLFSGGLSMLGQKSANKTNLQIARETNAANAAAVESTNKANRELAEYSYQKNLEQWNRENFYNLPSEQRARLEAAGLNPALMYGNVQNTSVSSPDYVQPTVQSPHYEGSRVSSELEGMSQVVNQLPVYLSNLETATAQREVLASQKEYNDARTLELLQEVRKKTTDAEVAEATKDYQIDLVRLGAENRQQDLDNKVVRRSFMLGQINVLELTAGLKRKEAELMSQRVDAIAQQIAQSKEYTRGLKLSNDFSAASFTERLSMVTQSLDKLTLELAILKRNGTKISDAMLDNLLDKHNLNVTAIGSTASRELRAWIYGWIPGTNPR